MSRSFVMGDIHGAFLALKECLSLAEFNYGTDRLICLGDVSDGWPEVKQCINELLKIENLIYIMGNHDVWTLSWFLHGETPKIWKSQGGVSTIKSYAEGIPESHVSFLTNARDYFVEKNRLFVHGGIELNIPMEEQNRDVFLWNRSLIQTAISLAYLNDCSELGSYSEIFVGHTPVLNFNSAMPLKYCNVWLMDTGAGWHGGSLSMMELDTGQIFRSRSVDELYPKFRGRKKRF